MKQANTVLVLGATGGIGGELARALVGKGWQVRAMVRTPARAEAIEGVQWVAGDALVGADVLAAAQGVDWIVHAVNPPGYRNWGQLVLPMVDNTIAAAKAVGAAILLPGTVYNYGADTVGPLAETTLQQPSSRKGAIRVEMERRLQASGVATLVVRAGDFFGPRSGNNWFSQGLIKPGQALKVITYPGADGVGHSWAYLPDLAATMVRLMARTGPQAGFETFHFRGYWDADGSAMIAALQAYSPEAPPKVRKLPWFALRLLAPFVTLFREMAEMRYLWQRPFELDNTKLVRAIGHEDHTPLQQAVAATLAGLGVRAPARTGAAQSAYGSA